MNNAIETFIEFSKHMGDLGINSGLPTIENSFGKLGENKLVVRTVFGIGVCHGPVTVVENKLSLRIDTYLLIGTSLGPVDSLNFYIIYPLFSLTFSILMSLNLDNDTLLELPTMW